MFVLTLKWNKKIALLLVIAAAVLLCAIILSIGSGDGSLPAKSGGSTGYKNRFSV